MKLQTTVPPARRHDVTRTQLQPTRASMANKSQGRGCERELRLSLAPTAMRQTVPVHALMMLHEPFTIS